jgi:para-aminobenzoate synthetase component 1
VSWPDAVESAVRAFAGERELAWLDSAVTDDLRTSPARYSLICRDPLAVLEQHEDTAAELHVGGSVAAAADNGWRLWRQTVERLPRCPRAACGLTPGWAGYVGFEMARQLERLPDSQRLRGGLPLMRMALYDSGIVLDHYEGRAYGLAATGVRAASGLRGPSLESLTEDWEKAVATRTRRCPLKAPRLCFEMERAAYERMVSRALEYIAAGDIYQVNLAQRLRFEGVGDPLNTYFELRCVNPAPYAAFLRWAGGAIGSVSPELFLSKRGREVLTRPIKGTRPRTGDPVLDGAYRRQLLDSAKDAAELAMIIDLHRNDLGRVCEFGSVRVRSARRLETHPTVFHTVADVAGRLRSDRDALDLLAACFPAGSVSGVPKIRALEIIDELEPVARGAYTGTVGVLGLDGQMTFNVAIRTLQFCEQAATLYVGGGIVADSDPADEYEETLAKARGIVRALERAKSELRIEAQGPAGFEAPSCVNGSV